MKTVKIKTTTRKFFHHYMTVTYPLHKIRPRERSVFAELLFWRHTLAPDVKTEEILNKLVFDADTKGRICKTLDMKKVDLNQCFSYLRERGFIYEKTIVPKFIPAFKKGQQTYNIIYNFNLDYSESTGENGKTDAEDSQ